MAKLKPEQMYSFSINGQKYRTDFKNGKTYNYAAEYGYGQNNFKFCKIFDINGDGKLSAAEQKDMILRYTKLEKKYGNGDGNLSGEEVHRISESYFKQDPDFGSDLMQQFLSYFIPIEPSKEAVRDYEEIFGLYKKNNKLYAYDRYTQELIPINCHISGNIIKRNDYNIKENGKFDKNGEYVKQNIDIYGNGTEYRIGKANKKGQKMLKMYVYQDGKLTQTVLKACNKDNHAYTDEAYSAKILGLEKEETIKDKILGIFGKTSDSPKIYNEVCHLEMGMGESVYRIRTWLEWDESKHGFVYKETSEWTKLLGESWLESEKKRPKDFYQKNNIKSPE